MRPELHSDSNKLHHRPTVKKKIKKCKNNMIKSIYFSINPSIFPATHCDVVSPTRIAARQILTSSGAALTCVVGRLHAGEGRQEAGRGHRDHRRAEGLGAAQPLSILGRHTHTCRTVILKSLRQNFASSHPTRRLELR